MKNIIITGSQLKREFFIWFVSFIVAVAVNVYSIIKYDTSWTELYTHLGYVVMISIMLYVALWALRGVFLLVRKIARKK
ncbi:MAG TPA: hypothetical protein VJ909_05460 [Prolixibacteraceae bacterium]|nr:hypothetical protein [Prolixibacteraceae bacterium]